MLFNHDFFNIFLVLRYGPTQQLSSLHSSFSILSLHWGLTTETRSGFFGIMGGIVKIVHNRF